jgi:hypothetical protein
MYTSLHSRSTTLIPYKARRFLSSPTRRRDRVSCVEMQEQGREYGVTEDYAAYN